MTQTRKIDVLSVGELLIDFISQDFAETMEQAEQFVRLQGGSPANMGMNMARLGKQVELVASVGNDDMGRFLKNNVEKFGINCRSLRSVASPTTLILVTRSKEVSDFQPYRGADQEISLAQFPIADFSNIAIFHTTCFALSKEPAQSNILKAAQLAKEAGCQLSIDANYEASKIWPDRKQAQQIVETYCKMGALVKISEVDWERLYEYPINSGEVAVKHFLQMGAKAVCLTLGGDGCYIGSEADGIHFIPTRTIEVKDTTGAGDAFWSGFLTAWLDQHPLTHCALAGRRMAEIKLGHFGPLPGKVERSEIYADF